MDPNNFLTEFNEGGSHEENPLGGIPQGMGSNGRMNTVEEGETRYEDYVFSDRLKVTDDMVKKYNLPKSVKGKTFADGSKIITKLTDGNPNSTTERETAEEMMERYILASEEARVMEELKNNPEMVQQLAQQMQGGGQGMPQGVQPEGMGMEGIPPQEMNPQMMGLEEGMPEEMGMPMQQQYFTGGYVENNHHREAVSGVSELSSQGPSPLFKGADPASNSVSSVADVDSSGGGGGGLSSGIMSGISTGLSVASSMLRKPQDETIIAGDPGVNKAITGVKSAIASATGPVGTAFFAASEAGKSAGDAIGGQGGAFIADAFSPEETTGSIFTTNKDASWDEKIALSMPGTGGIVNKILQDRKKAERVKLRDRENSIPNYARYGGNLNRFDSGGIMGRGGDDDKEKKLQKDINKATGLTFDTETANRLFERNIPQNENIELNPLDLGMYKGSNYFHIKNQGTDYVIHPTKTNPQNAAGYKDQINYLRKRNPDAVFDNMGYKQFADRDNQYANSGYLNNDPYGIMSSFRPLDYASNRGIMDDEDLRLRMRRATDPKPQAVSALTPSKPKNLLYPQAELANDISTSNDDGGGGGDKTFWGKLGDGAMQGMRYAPALTDAYQLATLNKPEQESLDRLDQRYKRNYVDERQIQNILSSEYNNAARGLTDASGGSASALRANLQGVNLSRLKAMSDAYMNIEGINRNEDAIAQQFDLSVNSTNLQQSNAEKEMNAKNKAAYDTNKSMLISQLGKNVGNIALEERRKNYPEWLDLYYDWRGRLTPDRNNSRDA